MFTFERCSLFMIYHKYCVTEWEKFGTEKKCSYFGVAHFLEVFTSGGFTVYPPESTPFLPEKNESFDKGNFSMNASTRVIYK